jgi:thiamine biosynthesis lipoprotein
MKRKFSARVGFLVLCALAVWGCGGKYKVHKETRLLLGTIVEITIGEADGEVAARAAALAFDEIERVDALLSSHNPESEVALLNASGAQEPTVVTEEVFSLLQRAERIRAASDGTFDVTVGPLLGLWQFDEGGRVPGDDEIAASLTAVGGMLLELDEAKKTVRFLRPGMAIDLGAIGKGYAVDRAAEILRSEGISSAIVDAGGDLRLIGSRPGKDFWRIGVQHPRDMAPLLLSLELADTAIVTSGDYERFFMDGERRYHHILDPRTGFPGTKCQSVTVIAPDTADADAYATAAFVLGPVDGLRFLLALPGVEGIIVDSRGELHWTDRAALGQ